MSGAVLPLGGGGRRARNAVPPQPVADEALDDAAPAAEPTVISVPAPAACEPERAPEPTAPAAEPEPATTPADYDDFDWDTNTSVICQSHRGVAAYLNRNDDLVIRKHGSWPDEPDDPFILIPKQWWPDFVLHLRNLGVIE